MNPKQKAESRKQKLDAPDVHIHIERLVLDGPSLDSRGAAQFQSALEAELARSLAAVPAAAWTGRSVARLSSAPAPFIPDASPAAWGRQTAQSVSASISAEAVSSQHAAPVASPEISSRPVETRNGPTKTG